MSIADAIPLYSPLRKSPIRYLILDILGQGTFGQVVKCQNMKTHEIVAVKVVKNKPAYFNQSMMEVTILELVSFQMDLPTKLAQSSPLRIHRIVEQPIRSDRRTSHPAATRFIHPPKSPVSGVRALVVQPLRADQTKPIPRVEHTAREGVYCPTVGLVDGT